jgi:predicted DNA-binding ribbon-helix-helix protein
VGFGTTHHAGRPRTMSLHLKKRSLILAGHDTSVALEPAFWAVLDRAATQEGEGLAQLVTRIDAARIPGQSLASALRVFTLEWLQAREPATPEQPA